MTQSNLLSILLNELIECLIEGSNNSSLLSSESMITN